MLVKKFSPKLCKTIVRFAIRFLSRSNKIIFRLYLRHHFSQVKVVVADIVQFLDPKPQGQRNHQQQPNPYVGNLNGQNQSAKQYGTGGGSIAVSYEDLPF